MRRLRIIFAVMHRHRRVGMRPPAESRTRRRATRCDLCRLFIDGPSAPSLACTYLSSHISHDRDAH